MGGLDDNGLDPDDSTCQWQSKVAIHKRQKVKCPLISMCVGPAHHAVILSQIIRYSTMVWTERAPLMSNTHWWLCKATIVFLIDCPFQIQGNTRYQFRQEYYLPCEPDQTKFWCSSHFQLEVSVTIENKVRALGWTCICKPEQGLYGSFFCSHNHPIRSAQPRVVMREYYMWCWF